MASVSSETLILFIASILVAASVAGTMTSGVDRVSEALGERSIDVSEEIRTDVQIISDPGSGEVYDQTADNLTILVKNTGSGALDHDPSNFDVLIDGTYHASVSTTVVDGTDWSVGNVVRLNATGVSLNSGDHRAMIIVNGDEEVMEFRT